MGGKWLARIMGGLAMLGILGLWLPASAAVDFRELNELAAYEPPAWFLEGRFLAREDQPRFIFGSVADFARAQGGATAWLIEEPEKKRLEKMAQTGKQLEYSVYLEVIGPQGPVYWMFVVMPHQSVADWFEERRRYHGSKAGGYYGPTQAALEKAWSQGMTIQAELRYQVRQGQVNLSPPEDLLLAEKKLKPLYDLSQGRAPGPTGNQ